jgi:hypothetical protein
MSRATITTASEANRRRARRTPVSGQSKIQCRKGRLGLGPNLVVKVLDLSETGACLIVKTALRPGDEAELLLSGPSFGRPLECPAEVVWSVALADGCHGVGLNFVKPIRSADRLRLAKV